MKLNIRYISAFIAFLFVEVFIALFIHDSIIRPYVGDVLAVVVVYCFLRIFMPPHKLLPIWIFLFAVLVESLQYFNIASILGVSENSFLSILAGAVFDFQDIICYFIGCSILMLWQRYKRE